MDIQTVTLKRLNYFVTVAAELHFGRAAEILHIAQPALSQQIRQLESDLGLQLFERTTRRVSLTPGGSAFLPHARHLLVTAQGVAPCRRGVSCRSTRQLAYWLRRLGCL